MSFYQEIIKLILTGEIQSKESLHKHKMKLCKKYHLKTIPANSEILAHIPPSLPEKQRQALIKILRKKPMRTISGVAIVAVMTSPAMCPHGKCIPCPGGPVFDSPQSYTGYEPAAMRASLHDFDPFEQVTARLHQLSAIGHPTDKIDLIIMGGTFTARSPWYQQWFVKRCFDALNENHCSSLISAQRDNERAAHRCIGLTIETRPDWFRLQHVDHALRFGATRVELGVQTVFDSLLTKMNRGHSVSDSIAATRIAKDAGLKICYHLMPGLPGSNEELDRECFETVFNNQDFKPDMIKIYPTVVVKGTDLYDQWVDGIYQPLSSDEATKRIARFLETVPRWVRIQRIQRDVPAPYIEAGVQMSNLRQLVDRYVNDNNMVNNDIRSRELGHRSLQENIIFDVSDISLNKQTYQASNASEIFLSLELNEIDALLGYLRLRDLNGSHRAELSDESCMIIRELKIVGQELSIGRRQKDGLQHQGFGKRLLKEAERICVEEYDKNVIFVLSGVGVKQYYRKYHGFKDKGVYLRKEL